MNGPHDPEVAMVECRHGGDLETLGDRDNGCVDEAEAEVRVPGDQLRAALVVNKG
jgi:hypothetical protein